MQILLLCYLVSFPLYCLEFSLQQAVTPLLFVQNNNLLTLTTFSPT